MPMFLTDTGTTVTIMPKEDWDNLFAAICSKLEPTVKCAEYPQDGYRTLERPGIASMKFDPLTFQVDNVIYKVPFDRFFESLSNDRLIFNEWVSNGSKSTLGMTFLDVFYQAYDMQRNQLALVVNLNNGELGQPKILERQPIFVIMAASSALVLCFFFFFSLSAEINNLGVP